MAAPIMDRWCKDSVINDLVAKLEETSSYKRRRGAIEDWNNTSTSVKRGIALTPVKFGISFNKTMLNQAGALVHVYTDGTVMLNHGGTEMGQGLFTKVKQITAEVFGIAPELIRTTPNPYRQSAEYVSNSGIFRHRFKRHGRV